jgi:peptide subunit release factor 1 (eRF1)
MIHFRHDNRIIFSQEVNITNRSVDETFQSPGTMIRKSLALCIQISFLPGDDRGMVIFKGAGGSFLVKP